MTISNRELYHSVTDNIAQHLNFYPTKIAVKHHQLRHLVSVAEGDRVYYVNGHDVYVLDLQNNQSTLLATVLFGARCLAAGYGWVCVGGEQEGNCAFIKLEPELGVPKCFGNNLNVKELGGDIVNSMNIHLMRHEQPAEPEPIVLISNNDKTLKIFSLAQREVLTTLEHDVPINHSAISPDSEVLAAVGDSDRVYFYKRRRKLESEETRPNVSGQFPEYYWRPLAIPVVPTGDSVHDDYGFAVTFSPSGHLCAASSQGGLITVLDMSILTSLEGQPEDAILCTFRSSRPTLCGCVRSMAFSPAPWDLLAWAEDHGRVGVADVRQMFVRRQVLKLDKTKGKTIHVEDMTPAEYRDLALEEKLRQQDLARPQTRRGPISDRERSQSLLQEAQINSAQRRQQHHMSTRRHGVELDALERSVLEALETTMDDVERSHPPYSLNYNFPPRFRPSSAADFAREYDVQLLNPGSRAGPRVHQPRRRPSVVLSESTVSRHLAPITGPRTRLSASPGRMTDDEEMPIMSTNDLTPTRGGSRAQPLPYNIPTSDPWHVIQSAMEAARQDVRRPGSAGGVRHSSLSQIEAALDAERRLGSQLEQQLADERHLSSFLRLQLETQNRLLQSQERELQAEREAGLRQVASSRSTEPFWEGMGPAQLQNEHALNEQRSREIETEILLGANRARLLEAELNQLLNTPTPPPQPRTLPSPSTGLPTPPSSSTSAQTSTLPTTNTSFSALTNRLPTPVASTTSLSNDDSLDHILQRHEAYRRQREAHFDNLERQIRRAESRVRIANEEMQAFEDSLQNRPSHASTTLLPFSSLRDRERERQQDQQYRDRVRAAIRLDEAPRSSASSLTRLQPISQSTTPSARWTATSETIRRPTEAEARVARLIAASRTNADANGNWMPGAALRSILESAAAERRNRERASGAGAVASTSTITSSGIAGIAGMSIEDIDRVMGVGTAGVSWSGDGRRLFAGSEEGIYEFKINVKDRMMSPAALNFR